MSKQTLDCAYININDQKLITPSGQNFNVSACCIATIQSPIFGCWTCTGNCSIIQNLLYYIFIPINYKYMDPVCCTIKYPTKYKKCCLISDIILYIISLIICPIIILLSLLYDILSIIITLLTCCCCCTIIINYNCCSLKHYYQEDDNIYLV